MKDDEIYDTLREKASKVTVPESLEPSEVEKQCQRLRPKRSYKKWYGLGMVAAAVLCATASVRERTRKRPR